MSKYKIVTRGESALGFQQQDVSRSVAQLCKYDEEKLKQVFSGFPFTFKSGLDAATADRYKSALDKTGIVCTVEADQQEAVIELATDEPVAISHHPAIDRAEGMRCPKCSEQQPKSPTCRACGIVIEKFNQRQEHVQYPEYVEPVAHGYVEEEASGPGLVAVVSKLVAVCILCVGGYFAYNAIFTASREVTVYRIENCAACDEAIGYLDRQGIASTVYDVEESTERRDEFLRRSDRAGVLPLLFVGDMRIDGNNEVMLQVAAAKYNGTLADNGTAEVVMYCRDSCGACKSAARFLDNENITFTNYDIDMPTYNAEYHRLQGAGTPLIFIGDIRIDGYSKGALEFVLDEAGLM